MYVNDLGGERKLSSIICEKMIVKNNRVDYFFNITGNLQKYFRISNHLFLDYNYDITNIPNSILTIPFVSNIIPLIWITDSKLFIDELDKSFYDCLNEIRTAYQKMFPNVRFKGEINVKRVVDNSYMYEHEAAALFSGGLDALTTFIRVKDKKPFLITEYGWHEDEITNSEVWEADKENAVNFAKINGLDNILIQSNYGNFINAKNIDLDFSKKLGDSWWHGLHHGLAIISAAIPIAYKLKINGLYIASSNSPMYQVSCASDPTVDNKIRYASGKVFHDGFELTRQDKVKVVVDHYSSFEEGVGIRVCFKNKENCCNCEKCLRTLLAIVAEGKNPRDYGFNIPDNLSEHVKKFLNHEVKFFTQTFIIIYWRIIQSRMKENYDQIPYKELLEWFIDYDFMVQRKRMLLKYRVTKFFPILKRKISTRLNRGF
ncbi:hypothetical protein D3C73_683760 [compost metagenome]